MAETSSDIAVPAPKDAWFTRLYNLCSREFGTTALYASNEFFAKAENLTNPGPAVWIADKYTDNGKWMDGWESARHGTLKRAGRDFCLLKLGVPGSIIGVDIDTMHFTGNYSEYASIEVCNMTGNPPWWRLLDEDVKWVEIVHKVALGAGVEETHNNVFAVPQKFHNQTWTHVRFNMYPDGGIARLRLFGRTQPVPLPSGTLIDAAAMVHGGLPIACSDMYFSDVKHLSMPGRGETMGDGWETKRSRRSGYHDWAVVLLGSRVKITALEIDTHWFKGNPPHHVTVECADYPLSQTQEIIQSPLTFDASIFNWRPLLGETMTLPNSQHLFRSEVQSQVATIVRINVFPDGGVMRLHVWGEQTNE